MSAFGSAPVEVHSASGIVIAEDGPRVMVYDRGLGAPAVTRFVFALIGLIFLAQAIVFTVLGLQRSDIPEVLGPVLLAPAALGIAGALLAHRTVARRRRRPLPELTPRAVFDRSTGAMLDGSGAIIAPLAHIRFRRRFAIGSSSPALVVDVTGGRTIKLANGNPFAGAFGRFDEALARVVFGVAQPR